MSNTILPKFHVRNLRSSSQPNETQESLVRISAPTYNSTISHNPAATLKYRDEDGDKITLGSSHELIEKLEEPVSQPSASSPRRRKDRMSITMLLSEVQQNPDALKYHTFDIEERDEIRKLWQEIQQKNKTPPPPSIFPAYDSAPSEDPSTSEDNGKDGEGSHGCSVRLGDQVTVKSLHDRNKDTKAKLAAAYNRLKVDFWNSIASEIGISSEEAEALHWALGRNETLLTTTKLDLPKIDPADRKIKTQSYYADIPTAPRFEDYGKHYFNATMPPQLRHAGSATQVPYAGVVKSTPSKIIFPPLSTAPAANLTNEGKRQVNFPPFCVSLGGNDRSFAEHEKAQAAGDILRSRTTPSRHRKGAINATDHASHQNRWASYKSPNAGFTPTLSTSPSQIFNLPTLTAEGRRQAQAAGDKLRLRTNPIRHSRPSRSGSLDHGVSNNRWASYVGPRISRFEERHRVPAELKPTPLTTDPVPTEQEKQHSLLEVFEAELAKSFPDAGDLTRDEAAPEPGIVDIPPPVHDSRSASADPMAATADQMPPSPQQPKDGLHGVELFNDYIERLTSGDRVLPQELSNIVDHGVRAAVGAVGTVVQGIPGLLHNPLDQAEPLAAKNWEADVKGIDDALNGLRNIVNNFASDLGFSGSGDFETDAKKGTNDGSTTSTSGPEPIEALTEYATEALELTSSALSQINPAVRDERSTPLVDTTATAAAHLRSKSRSPHFISEIRPACQTRFKDDPPKQSNDMSDSQRDHEPELVSPYHDTRLRPEHESLSHTHRHNDHLYQYQNALVVNEPTKSPPPAATRFPTLAQFERQDFAASPAFPALPSMEPLVPQRLQGAGNVNDTHFDGHLNTADVLPDISEEQICDSVLIAHECLKGTSLYTGSLSDIQLFSLALQNCDDQQKTILTRARAYAKKLLDQEQFHALQKSQMQLIFLEQQSSKRWLMATQEQRRCSIGCDSSEETLTKQRFGDNPSVEKYTASATREQSPYLEDPQLPGSFPNNQTLHHQVSNVAAAAKSGDLGKDVSLSPCSLGLPGPSSAARLAEPFDPLDVEPSAQPHPTQGIRRNATVAGTHSSHYARRRRPYSEAFDGIGRVAWESFERPTQRENFDSRKLGDTMNLATEREQPRRSARGHQRRLHSPRRRATLHQSRSISPSRRPDCDHQDESTVHKINLCVSQLRDIGIGNGHDRLGDRLLIYAQAAKGDLVEAIDMIDEEQRAYQRL